MGSNVFVSYKYNDSNVEYLKGTTNTTCRDYVDKITDCLKGKRSYYYRGENDGEDLSNLNETTIAQKLADKIFYTSVTVVLISANMKDNSKKEIDQWIPWEISYSLKEIKRDTGKSNINAILAVVIPNAFGSYEHAIIDKPGYRVVQTDNFFKIISNNMFNIKDIEKYKTPQNHYNGPISYIPIVKWSDFILNPEKYLSESEACRDNQSNYNIVKKIE